MERLFQLPPLPSLAPQKTPLWNPSIQEIRHGNLWSMKSKQQSSCPFAPRSRFPPQKSKCHEQLHLVTLLKALMRSTHWDGFSLNFPSKSGLFCYVSLQSAQSWGTAPSSWPWSPLYLSDTLPQARNNRPWGASRTEAPTRSYFQLRMFWPAAQALFRFLMFFRIFSLHHWEKHN